MSEQYESSVNMKDVVNLFRACPSTFTNKMITSFVDELRKNHPTHQANIIRNMQHILIAFGQQSHSNDLRNKSAVEFCKQVNALEAYIDYV